jgi:periplasmic protein TonB
MAKDLKRMPKFDDIVFAIRNKEYGGYLLRKKYNRNVIISILIGIMIMLVAIIPLYLNAKSLETRQTHSGRMIEIKMEKLEQPIEKVVPPPPAPPAQTNIIKQQKYVPPQIVDSVKPEEVKQLITTEQVQTEVTDKEVAEVAKQGREEVQQANVEPEPFMTVQEMPEPSGGVKGLMKYIADNTIYPAMARENNIQGKVYVRFCVTSTGSIDQVSILKGVDRELDAEAIRIVKTFPPFKPGKQDGIPVPVWFNVFINFQLY